MEEIELIKITVPQDKAYLVDEHVKTFANIVGKMTTLYAKKNHDYGNSFDEGCDKIGVGYPLGRLLDKMNRLIACMGKEDEMQINESIEDTLTDLACYSVMTLSYLRRNKISSMTNKRNKYKELIDNIESIRIYDGRDKGVNVYICEKCGKTFLTRYKDKGVTPFAIACRNEDCKGTMVHKHTITEKQVKKEGLIVHNWVRPTLEQFDEFVKQGKTGLIEHLVQGGLVLEEELK